MVFFSLEMSSNQLASRVLSSQAKIQSTHMRDGTLTDEEIMYQWAQQISEMADYENCVPKPESTVKEAETANV